MSVFGALGSVVNGVFGLIGARQQNKSQMQQLKYQYDRNAEMMREQNAWNEQMWDKTNQYNSPIEQRKRMEAAGLNPMFYGLDGSSAGGLQSASFSAPSGMPVQNELGALGQGIGDAAMQQAQIELIKAQAKKTEVETEGQTLENEIKNSSKGDLIKWNNVQWRVGEASIDKQVADAKLASEQTSAIQTTLDNQKRALDLHEQEVNVKKISVALDQMRLDKDIKQQAIDYFIAMQHLSVDWYNAKTNRTVGDSQAKYYDKQSERIDKLLPFEISHAKNDLILQYFNNIKANNESVKVLYEAVKAAKEGLYGSDTMSQLCGTLDSLLGTLGLQTPGTSIQDEARSHSRFASDPSNFGTTEPAYERWSRK